MENFTYKHLQISAICLLLSFLFAPSLQSQTVHISPTGNGGFELGPTFADNGWSVDTPAASTGVQWVCNSGSTGHIGTRSAYISDGPSLAIPPHSYSGVATTSHLFRTITIASSEPGITLSFDWKCRGETSYDRMRIFLAPTTYTPIYGTQIITSGTAPTGLVQVGLSDYSVNSAWLNASVIIPPEYAGTSFKLIFEWRNDASIFNQPPAAIDNISLISAPLTSYCTAGGSNSSRYINNFSTTGGTTNINNTTGYSAGGYGNYTSQALVGPASSIINFSTSFNGGTHGFNIWVDWNDNFIFEASERMYASGAYGNGFTGSFIIPSSATTGNHRMRIRANWSFTNPDPCGFDGSGETEDYTLTVQPLACSGLPSAITASAITINSATINFTAATPPPALGYVYYFSTVATPPAFASAGSGSTTTTSFNLTGLASSTRYYVWIRSNCGGTNGTGAWSNAYSFWTLNPIDNCSSAILAPVNSGSTCTNNIAGTTVGATQSLAGCTGTADDDVWFKFVATSTSHVITVTQGSLSDSVFQVFSGTCAAAASLLCSDPNSATLGGLTIGSTYFIRVYSFSNSPTAAGTFTLCITTPPPPPANDSCSGAINVPVNSGISCTSTVSGNTSSATQSQSGCIGTANDDVWYSFVASATSHIITVTAGTLNDSVFEVFSGSCTSLTSILCSDPPSGTVSGLTIGSTYYIRVYSYFSSPTNFGTFTLCITTPVPITNDNCINATAVAVSSDSSCTTMITATTTGATQSQPGCVGTADDDVWFSFVALSTSHLVSVTEGSMSDSVFQVFSGGCAGLVSLKCSDPNSSTITGLTIGNTYYIRVYSYSSSAGSAGTFNLCITTPVPPCSTGSGMGVSTSCPTSITGGLGLNGAPAPAVTCASASGCTTLEVQYLQLGQPTSYSVESIPYAPPYQFSCLANTVDATVDDVWSPIVNLPFNFCFYGVNYNKVLISSNGVITFDTTNNTPGGTSTWDFTNNLPSTNLFKNSIFGVYHDINPTIGGIIGWELIELDTGCRALVASWANVPMFGSSCGHLNYTGMIVLYENTNIIEVHVKEKRECASWNDGNAIIGLQNGTGTVATVAPNRNGLDPNWTTTNESWRFIPNGTSITTINWYQGNTATGTVLGTGNTLSVCPSTTTNYTAKVSYAICGGGTLSSTGSTTVTVNSKAKTWNGSVNTDWNNANNWTPPGVPTNINCVTIPATANQAIISNAASALNVALTSTGRLTVEENHSLQIEENITVSASADFTIKNSGSLVQVANTANTGIMKMIRKTQPMYRYDYSYWNSPVTNASGFTLGALSPATLSDKFYKWQPYFTGSHGNWVQQSPATAMVNNVGYIVRAPQTFSTSPAPATKQVYTATFVGTPNNGNISAPISRGTMPGTISDDKWNLIGNPYPSAVSAASLLSSNSAVVDGTIYLWTHNSAISAEYPDPFYGDFVYNYSGADYAVWNTFGATAATSGGELPNGFIPAGASFFIKSKVAAGSVTFNNAMRVRDYNNQFFKSGTDTFNEGESTFEKHRIWLNMMNSSNLFSQIVVGYSEGATLNYDSGLDAERLASATTAFYSTIEDYNLAIQARPLPFDVADVVPLGYITDVNDEFSIRIHETDPLFENYEIILEDKSLNVFHNLKMSPYFFTTATGRYNDRFALRFMDNLLGVDAPQQNTMLSAFVKNDFLNVKCSNPIEIIIIYDVTGKAIKTINPDASMTEHRWQFPFAQGAYFAKFTMSDGKETTRKLMH